MGNSDSQMNLDIGSTIRKQDMNDMNDTLPYNATPKLSTFTQSTESIDNNSPLEGIINLDLTFNKYPSISETAQSTISSSYASSNNISKLLYYMNTNTLASLTQYIMENEPYFTKYKHESLNTYNAFISYKMRGKMLVKYSNVEFCNRLPWIRTVITSLLYDRLRSLSDEEIEAYLSKINEINQPIQNHRKSSKITIRLPDYLKQIDIVNMYSDSNSDTQNSNNTHKLTLNMCNAYEFQIFVYILCISNQYNETDTKLLLDALIKLDMNGTQFMDLKRTQFYRKLKPYNIKASACSKVYKVLISYSQNIHKYFVNNNVSLILNQTQTQTQTQTHETKYSKDVVNELVNLKYGTETECVKASQQTINYWDINEVADKLNNQTIQNIEDCDKDNFGVFLYNICNLNGFSAELISNICNTLNTMNGKDFIHTKRVHFVRKLKENGIKGAIASKIHKLLLKNKENICQYLDEHLDEHLDNKNNGTTHDTITHMESSNNYSSSITPTIDYSTKQECYTNINEIVEQLNETISNVSMCNCNEFIIFVRNLCIKNKFNETDIKSITNALTNMEITGEQFMSLKRVNFCRKLREYEIKGALASKLYKLLSVSLVSLVSLDEIESTNRNAKGLSAHEIAEIAVADFQVSAGKMLNKMNESMKLNMVNGTTLMSHYNISKESLKIYLNENVIQKSVNILLDLLWNKINETIVIKYDRRQLLKYFISLYMYQTKYIILKYELNENKCNSLKRKAICDILRNECGFSIGVATNIVHKIYSKINP